MNNAMAPKTLPLLLAAALSGVCGCGSNQLPVAPAEGKVLYRGKPLEFGSVMFQPELGPAARGLIQPDGTFQLRTSGLNDGAVIGEHKVRIACVESQRPGAASPQATDRSEPGVGRSLIPPKYANFAGSGLRVEVLANNIPFVFELED